MLHSELLRGPGPLASVQQGSGYRVVIISGENGKKDVAHTPSPSLTWARWRLQFCCCCCCWTGLEMYAKKKKKKWASVQWWAVPGFPVFDHFCVIILMQLMVCWECKKILGVFLDRNHFKHTHSSWTTQPHCPSAGKYSREGFCRTHALSNRHHHLPAFASIPQGWHFILMTHIFAYCAYASCVIVDEKWNGDLKKKTFFVPQNLCL